MRSLFYLFLLFIVACKNENNNRFTIEGKIANAVPGTIYLEETPITGMQPVIVDSSKPGTDGRFKLTAENTEESVYILRYNNQGQPFASVINDSRYISVDAEFNNAGTSYRVKGSNASSELKEFIEESNKQLSGIYAYSLQIDSLQSKAYPDSLLNEVKEQRKKRTNNYKNYMAGFINKTKSPSVTIFALGSYQSYASSPVLHLEPYTADQIKQIIARTAQRFPHHKGVAQLADIVKNEKQQAEQPKKNSLLNKPAPDFTLESTTGKNVTLSSYKGKYVLVDFWASWCGPCRAENPNVVNAYQKFRNKNFTILGVSLDKEKDAWINAINEDRLGWMHVSDLKFWDSMVVPLYGIESIPYNVLIDPNGIVIAEHLTGSDLEQKLSEVLK